MRPIALLSMTLAVSAVALRAQMPASLQEIDRQSAQLAIEAAARGPAVAIPMSLGRGRTLASVYDQFIIGVQIARARTTAGETATVETLLNHESWKSRATVTVAYPIDCDGRPNHPIAIRWAMSGQSPVAPSVVGEPLRGDAGQSLLPGVAVPTDALVVAYRNVPPIGATLEVDYENPVCGGANRTAVMQLAHTPARELSTAFAGVKLPDQFASLPSPSTVRISVRLDPTGRPRFPTQMQGPAELGPVAIAAMEARTFPPATTNGVPVVSNVLVTFVFTTTGERAPAAPFVPGPAPPGTMQSTSTLMVRGVPPAASPLPPVPPAPPGQANAQLTRLAIELGEQGEVTPVPLDAAGAPTHGVLYDGFLVTAVKARAASKAGNPMNPAVNAAPGMEDMVVVAFPLVCDGKTIAPKDILGFNGGATAGPLRETSPLMFKTDLDSRLPGVTLPAGAVGRSYTNVSLANGLEFRVRYAEPPCGAQDAVVTLPIQWTRGTPGARFTTVKLPEGSTLPSPTTVRIRGFVDTKGAYRFPTMADGPAELGPNAAVLASTWKYDPYRANGVAMPQGVITPLTFTATGMPEAAPPTGAPTPAPTSGPPIMTSTTVDGRLPGNRTNDEPGLTAATSKCAIATDATYGVTAASPIKVGGDFKEGPARERQYLSSLRGPNGQGLTFVRRGSTMAPDKTILDAWEVSYSGLAKPIVLFLDEYHEEPLKAPQGFVCAVQLAR